MMRILSLPADVDIMPRPPWRRFSGPQAALVVAALCASLLGCSKDWAGPVPVRYREGASHGFLVLQTLDGRILASGDDLTLVRGDRVTTELVFHFPDGSLDSDTTVFSQHHYFRLLSDHQVEKGPAFPRATDATIDAVRGRVTVKSTKNGKEKVSTKRLQLPADLSNGMTDILLRNMNPNAPQTLSYVTASSSPRVVKLLISSSGKEPFFVAGEKFRAIHYVIKVKIGGLAGVIAPLVGKKPPDVNIWILGGKAPAFLRADATLYDGGPIWRVQLAAPVWPRAEEESATQAKPKR
ncbi:MAG: hypothetical protein ACRD3D_02245 [Terriglobia bacterium]